MNLGLKLALDFAFIVFDSRPVPVPHKFIQHETTTQRESLKIHAVSEIGKQYYKNNQKHFQLEQFTFLFENLIGS
jgi:hypothetical protein